MAAHDAGMQVRLLTVDDLGAYRALHRFALREAAQAFVETLADDARRPDAAVAEMLARGEGWGLFDGERLVGKLVLDAMPYECLAHTRWLHAIYLHPDARGRGAGVRWWALRWRARRPRAPPASPFGSWRRTGLRGGCTSGSVLWRPDASPTALQSLEITWTTSS